MTTSGNSKDKKNNLIQTLHRCLISKEPFLFSNEENLLPIARYLMRAAACSLFLKKEAFEKLFPILTDMILPENKIKLIVPQDLLKNEEESLAENHSHAMDSQNKPCLSDLLGQEHIYVYPQKVHLNSFIVINHRSYFIETKPGHFICDLNAIYDAERAERLDRLYRTFSFLKQDSIVLTNILPQKVTQSAVPFQNMNENIRG